MPTVARFCEENHYLRQTLEKRNPAVREALLSRYKRFTETVSTLDIVISCLIQGILVSTEWASRLAIQCYFQPQFLATPLDDFKKGLVSQNTYAPDWYSQHEFTVHCIRAPVVELIRRRQSPDMRHNPWFLKDWKDHFTELAVYKPEARFKHMIMNLKKQALSSLLFGGILYFSLHYVQKDKSHWLLNNIAVGLKNWYRLNYSPFYVVGSGVQYRLIEDTFLALDDRFRIINFIQKKVSEIFE